MSEDINIVFFIIGIMISVIALTMFIPIGIDIYYGENQWLAFLISMIITIFTGIVLITTNKREINENSFNLKTTFLLTVVLWIFLVNFSALPFILSDTKFEYVDAFFESMSAYTTTGVTVMVDLEHAPKSILFWRSFLNWVGGIGIVVIAIAVLPLLKIGGMELFRSESSDKSEKMFPKVGQICFAISLSYVFITVACTVSLLFAGMGLFDSICHAMSTIATGGLSTHDSSIGFYNSVLIEMIVAFFMFLSGIPFLLHAQALYGKYKHLTCDTQVRSYTAILLITIIVVSLWTTINTNLDWLQSMRYSIFNVISVVTTTGFYSTDYTLWGNFIVVSMFLLSAVGGCTGSTSGAIKIFRFQILFETAKSQIYQLIQPNGVFKPKFNHKIVSDEICYSVMGFVILYAVSFSVIAVLLSLTGLDYVTSMSASATTLGNVGIGIGDVVGPTGSYVHLSDFAKWILSGSMLIGRLELYTFFVLFAKGFWKV